MADPVITKLAEKYDVTAGQIILKWDVQQGRVVIPKSESESNMRANLELDQFSLTEQELTAIDKLNRDERFGDDPVDAFMANLDRPVPEV